jgi:hypothetical protein
MDTRTIELIHGDIDGENSRDEERELTSRLEASAEARREYEELRKLCQALDAAPTFEPPPDLREAIIGRIFRPVAPVIPLRRPRAWLGAAAALAATAAGVALLLGRAPEFPASDPSALVGTIGSAGTEAASTSLRLDERPLSGAISLHRALNRDDGAVAMEIELEAGRPVEILAGAAGMALRIEELVGLDGAPEELAEIDGRIRVLHRGNQRYALVLASESGTPASIDLSIYEGDRLIRQGRLVWPVDTPVGPE